MQTELNVHVLAGLAVCSRVADVWTTYLVTPTLKIEANAVARRLGWPYALLTILAGLITYYSEPIGIMLFSMSFLVAASNASKILMAKALGEEDLAALSRRVILATPPWPGLLFLVLPGIFVGIVGGFLVLYGGEWELGYYVGLGMLALAGAVFVWFPVRYFRVRTEAAQAAR
jgi:hypothetical protein